MLRVLHLSDLHFGLLSEEQQKEHHAPPSAHRFVRDDGTPDHEELAAVLAGDPELKIPPDIVIVSGDLGWSGASTDYVHALAFLRRLQATWPGVDVVVAPGNHDVNWARFGDGSSALDSSQDEYLSFVKDLYGDDFAEIYKLLEPGPPLSRDSLVGFHHRSVRGQKWLAVTVNSAAHIVADKGRRAVHLRPTILRRIHDVVQQIDADLKIFVLHHHLLPFAEPSGAGVWNAQMVPDEPDPTIVANSAKLQTWLAQHSFSVVVHGHKHLSHGRMDVLWKKTDAETGRRLFVVGAGSAGVATHERGPNIPLGYNAITLTQLSTTRWQADVSVRQVDEHGAYPTASSYYDYTADCGPYSDSAPIVIHATRADQCHEAIRARSEGRGLLHNFMSIVDEGRYVSCPTARDDGREVDDLEIERSFQALHPEYRKSEAWRKRSEIESALHAAGPRFQFSHGPRLFGIPDAARKLSNPDPFRPIVRALENLNRGSVSNAYVGLFRPEIDVVSENDEPLPALIGLQFIPREQNRLDLVASFRKLELSYWWVVNMYEAAKLLEWGSSHVGRRPGRVTFFAPLAEWKRSPETTLVSEIDSATIGDFLSLFVSLSKGDAAAGEKLRGWLEEKRLHTNEKNLDARGLERAGEILNGLVRSDFADETFKALHREIETAFLYIRSAMKHIVDDETLVEKAKVALAAAIELLQPRS